MNATDYYNLIMAAIAVIFINHLFLLFFLNFFFFSLMMYINVRISILDSYLC